MLTTSNGRPGIPSGQTVHVLCPGCLPRPSAEYRPPAQCADAEWAFRKASLPLASPESPTPSLFGRDLRRVPPPPPGPVPITGQELRGWIRGTWRPPSQFAYFTDEETEAESTEGRSMVIRSQCQGPGAGLHPSASSYPLPTPTHYPGPLSHTPTRIQPNFADLYQSRMLAFCPLPVREGRMPGSQPGRLCRSAQHGAARRLLIRGNNFLKY